MKSGGIGGLLGILFLLMICIIATVAVPLMMSQSDKENPMSSNNTSDIYSPYAEQHEANNNMLTIVTVILLGIDIVLGIVALLYAGLLVMG